MSYVCVCWQLPTGLVSGPIDLPYDPLDSGFDFPAALGLLWTHKPPWTDLLLWDCILWAVVRFCFAVRECEQVGITGIHFFGPSSESTICLVLLSKGGAEQLRKTYRPFPAAGSTPDTLSSPPRSPQKMRCESCAATVPPHKHGVPSTFFSKSTFTIVEKYSSHCNRERERENYVFFFVSCIKLKKCNALLK